MLRPVTGNARLRRTDGLRSAGQRQLQEKRLWRGAALGPPPAGVRRERLRVQRRDAEGRVAGQPPVAARRLQQAPDRLGLLRRLVTRGPAQQLLDKYPSG